MLRKYQGYLECSYYIIKGEKRYIWEKHQEFRESYSGDYTCYLSLGLRRSKTKAKQTQFVYCDDNVVSYEKKTTSCMPNYSMRNSQNQSVVFTPPASHK